MKNLTPPRPELTYVLEVTHSELLRLAALAYRYESVRTLPRPISGHPYLNFEINFPEIFNEMQEIMDADPENDRILDFFFEDKS